MFAWDYYTTRSREREKKRHVLKYTNKIPGAASIYSGKGPCPIKDT
jgi:hypothetical protein